MVVLAGRFRRGGLSLVTGTTIEVGGKAGSSRNERGSKDGSANRLTPLTINDAAELALRRPAPRVSAGNTIGAFSAFRELMAVELPGIDVDPSTGPLSPAWLSLPLDALDSMTRDAPDEGLDVDELVETDHRATWPLPPRAELVWISDHADRDHGWWRRPATSCGWRWPRRPRPASRRTRHTLARTIPCAQQSTWSITDTDSRGHALDMRWHRSK